MQLEFQDVTFIHADGVEPLFEDLNLVFYPGWTGVVGPNGSGKTTLLQLASGELVPSAGRVFGIGTSVFCPQRTDDAPVLLADLLEATDGEARRLMGTLRLEDDWLERWSSLSQGERKRAQIAVSLWQQPDLLLIDEPTNHIDSAARELLFRALQQFRGVGILVSHDRELLDGLCSQCLFLGTRTPVLRPGGYSQASQQAVAQRESQLQQRMDVGRQLQHLQAEYNTRRGRALTADARNTKRGISPKDKDAKARVNMARLTGKDAVDGKLTAQLEGRLGRLQQQFDSLTVELPKETGIWMPAAVSQRDSLFLIPPGTIPLPGGGVLQHSGLRMGPTDRIGITGPNGSGKTTLLRHLEHHFLVPPDKVLYLPQELGPDDSSWALQRLSQLNRAELGLVMTIVTRLGSSASRVLASTAPSPGELRKLVLALGIQLEPHLIIMDEPTNHLDIVAIECLEKALADAPCGLLLVSHDKRFLSSLVTQRWHISDGRIASLPA